MIFIKEQAFCVFTLFATKLIINSSKHKQVREFKVNVLEVFSGKKQNEADWYLVGQKKNISPTVAVLYLLLVVE